MNPTPETATPPVSRWLKPLIAISAALAAGTLLMAPMIGMEPRDLPLAVVNLDQSIETTQGTIDAGSAVADTVLGNDADGMIAWMTLDSQAALDDALENNEVYAALVIPADLSEAQASAQQAAAEAGQQAAAEAMQQGADMTAAQAAGETAAQQAAAAAARDLPPLKLIVNEGKNPMVSSQLGASLAGLTGASPLAIETEYHNEVPDSLGMVVTFLPMVMMILVYIASYAGGIVIRSTFPMGANERGKTITAQLTIAALGALITGFSAALILSAFVPDLTFTVGGAGLFLAIASFALMTVVIGSINWVGMVGMAVPVLILILGLGPADLPYEFLPSFWQHWVYPWNPLQFLANGARALLFQGAGWWNAATLGLVITAIVGSVLVATSALTPRGKPSPALHHTKDAERVSAAS